MRSAVRDNTQKIDRENEEKRWRHGLLGGFGGGFEETGAVDGHDDDQRNADDV